MRPLQKMNNKIKIIFFKQNCMLFDTWRTLSYTRIPNKICRLHKKITWREKLFVHHIFGDHHYYLSRSHRGARSRPPGWKPPLYNPINRTSPRAGVHSARTYRERVALPRTIFHGRCVTVARVRRRWKTPADGAFRDFPHRGCTANDCD